MLEAFLRVAYPEHFPPGTLLGYFLDKCRQRTSTPQEIVSAQDTQELGDLIEYANKFHHDTNAAWETEAINDGELTGLRAARAEFRKTVIQESDFARPKPLRTLCEKSSGSRGRRWRRESCISSADRGRGHVEYRTDGAIRGAQAQLSISIIQTTTSGSRLTSSRLWRTSTIAGRMSLFS